MRRFSYKSILAVSVAASQTALAAFPDCANGPLKDNLICNPSADPLSRAKALVDVLTVDELIANTVTSAAGSPRLGLPPYVWWNEALHGIAGGLGSNFSTDPGSPFSFATSFPSPILMAAAFDDELISAVATVISTEARAFNNGGHAGLDFFTPNINPFKDPRWGRGQETPGEDPYVIQRYVYQYVTALQGGLNPDPYLKVVADCKHFAGYDLENWSGNDRWAFKADISTQDLAEYYTPSFQTCVRDAHAGSVMCSYTAINGVPSCANDYLLQDILREHYGMGDDGWVVSDCDAVLFVWYPQGYTTTEANATALSLKAGTDIDCAVAYTESLPTALNETLVSVDNIKTALTRTYASLVKLGYFDAAEGQPYRQLGWSDVNTPDTQALAVTAAAEGMVLLKNDGTLPLSNDTKTIALIGPWFNATTQMQGDYSGTAPFLISPLQGLQAAGFEVWYAAGATINDTDTSGFTNALNVAKGADVIVYAGGLDNSLEIEFFDRQHIGWPGVQLDLINELAKVGKPLVVLQFGAGQVDDSTFKTNDAVNALVWGGYPGQAGGTAVAQILTGKTAPAGRLPITQYPAEYVDQIPMTDMSLRPHDSSPGRTYKWYTGTPVFEFGFGLHYTTFNVSWSSPPPTTFAISDLIAQANATNVSYVDSAPLATFSVDVQNTGKVASDYVALLFSNTTAGPAPAPLKELISFARVKGITPGQTGTAQLNVTLGSIARVDENGNSALYPGTYNIWVDTTKEIVHTFELTGERTQIISFPQPR